jgi:hypothetical protein
MARGSDQGIIILASFREMLRQHILTAIKWATPGLDFGEAMRSLRSYCIISINSANDCIGIDDISLRNNDTRTGCLQLLWIAHSEHWKRMLKTLPIYFVIGVYHYVRVCIALS